MSDDLVKRLLHNRSEFNADDREALEAAAEITHLRERIASLEAELDLANKQIAETGRAWTEDRAKLEKTIAQMGEALRPFAKASIKWEFKWDKDPFTSRLNQNHAKSDLDHIANESYDMTVGDLRRSRAALTASESVVEQSTGEDK